MESYRYLVWLSISWIPCMIAWTIWYKDLKPYTKTGFVLNIITFIPAALWDYLAMKDGIWYFIPPFITPLLFHYFPLEEFMLIATAPWIVMTAVVMLQKLTRE